MELLSFLPLFLIMGAFLFFASRRQRKAMQATIDLHDSLRVGDRVYTTSGLAGSITALTDDTVDLEIAPGVVTEWMKLAIREKIDPVVPEALAEPTSGAVEAGEADAKRLAND